MRILKKCFRENCEFINRKSQKNSIKTVSKNTENKTNKPKKRLKKTISKELTTAKGVLERKNLAQNIEGVGVRPSRVLSFSKQLTLAQKSLVQRQGDLEKLYLGTKNQKAFFKVFEQHLGRFIDTKSGLVGAIGNITKLYNPSLEKKLTKHCGIKPERFREVYKSMQKELNKNMDSFSEVEQYEAKINGLSLKEFRKKGEYKSFASDMLTIGLSLGLNALGVATGVAIPLMSIAPKRKAFAMNADESLRLMRDGMSYTKAISYASKATDKATFMAYNLMKNSDILQAGKNYKNIKNLNLRWKEYLFLRNKLSVKKNPENIADKNFYESLGMVINSQGIMHLQETKKFRRMFFGLTERWSKNKKQNKQYKEALKILKKVPKKKVSETQIINLNKQKLEAIKNIHQLMNAENCEDALRRKYRKHPEKMEGRWAAEDQIRRFAQSQTILVKNQRNLFRLKTMNSSAKNNQDKKADILYKTAVFSLLNSFDSAKQLFAKFPILPKMTVSNKGMAEVSASEKEKVLNLKGEIQSFYLSINEDEVVFQNSFAKLTKNSNFQNWMKRVGEWSQAQAKNPRGYSYMSCAEKIKFDQKRLAKLANCRTKNYKFNPVSAVAPYKGKIPLILNTSWFGEWGNFSIGKNSKPKIIDNKPDIIEGTKSGQQIHGLEEVSTEALDFGDLQNALNNIPEEVLANNTTEVVEIATETAASTVKESLARKAARHFGGVAVGMGVSSLLSPLEKTGSVKRITKDRNARYENYEYNKEERKDRRQKKEKK